MSDFVTAFIGAGNMARSFIGGMLASGVAPESLRAADPMKSNRELMATMGALELSASNTEAVRGANVVVLAVKPQVLKNVCEELRAKVEPDTVVVSIAAGVETTSLQAWLGADTPIARCMPNTPALVGKGASALFCTNAVTPLQKDRIERVMKSVGAVCWVEDEDSLHSVTALSGSGPAYFFLMMEAMIAEGERMGLDPQTARLLCSQTCLGAGYMLREDSVPAAELRRRVTSPGGTTERAIRSFEQDGFATLIQAAMRECYKRSQELAEELT
ncbi:MAG: pyrroline-5-carboxylate reductase [Pseudomonadota bacterium]